jgi:hypothetical protein
MAMKRLMVGVVLVSASACDTTKCPDGTFRVGSVCRAVRDGGSDAGSGAEMDESGDDWEAGTGAPDSSLIDGPDATTAQPCGTPDGCAPGTTVTCTTACGTQGTGACTLDCTAAPPAVSSGNSDRSRSGKSGRSKPG